jgi:CheY-like chemotaxis protein
MLRYDTVFLVVDDFEAMRRVTAAQLRTLGYENIHVATNGADALRLLQKQRVDMVLSDLNMPGMTGLELLQAVRADKRLCHLPFIAITAEADRPQIEAVIASGVTSVLVKPYTAENLRLRLERAAHHVPMASQPVPVEARAAGAEPAPGPCEANVPAEVQRPTVLVVDDTPENLQLLTELFKDEYRVRVASNGRRALEICSSDAPPDLVLLDVMMPGLDGFEVARRMREHPTSEMIPIIFITALHGDDAQIKGLDLGAVDYVRKPIQPDLLKARVRNFMRYLDLRRQLQADYDRMLETARLKERVEVMMRHDMKGPIASIIGLLQATLSEQDLNRRDEEHLRLAESAAFQLLNLVNLSTDLFKIESGTYELDARPFDIGADLRRIVEMLRHASADKGLIIAVDSDADVGREPPQVLGDATLCVSLFANLLKNACEAAPPGSRVDVALQDTAPLRVTITNRGVVPAAIRGGFFEKFVSYGKPRGTGIGAYSARQLARAQGGDVELDVSDDAGTTSIKVTLPRAS